MPARPLAGSWRLGVQPKETVAPLPVWAWLAAKGSAGPGSHLRQVWCAYFSPFIDIRDSPKALHQAPDAALRKANWKALQVVQRLQVSWEAQQGRYHTSSSDLSAAMAEAAWGEPPSCLRAQHSRAEKWACRGAPPRALERLTAAQLQPS